MNLVTVFFKANPQVLQFHFDKYTDAVKALSAQQDATPVSIFIVDDYGSQARILYEDVAAIAITDLDREMVAHEAVDLFKTRKDLRVQKTIQREAQSGIATVLNRQTN